MNIIGKGITYCRKHDSHKPDYTASQPRRQNISLPSPRKPQTLQIIYLWLK